MEILNEKAVGINEIKVHIDSIKKREKELNFRAKKVEEYINNLYAKSEPAITCIKIPNVEDSIIIDNDDDKNRAIYLNFMEKELGLDKLLYLIPKE